MSVNRTGFYVLQLKKKQHDFWYGKTARILAINFKQPQKQKWYVFYVENGQVRSFCKTVRQ